MEDKIIGILQTLADKLCTTVEHLWVVLTAQAKVQAMADITTCVMLLVALAALVYVGKTRVFVEGNEDERDGGYHCGTLVIFTGIVLSVLFLGFSFQCVHEVYTAIFNPEYWALTHVLHLIGK